MLTLKGWVKNPTFFYCGYNAYKMFFCIFFI